MTKCAICKRKLTDPISIEIGMGPVCRKKTQEAKKEEQEFLDNQDIVLTPFCFLASTNWLEKLVEGILGVKRSDINVRPKTSHGPE